MTPTVVLFWRFEAVGARILLQKNQEPIHNCSILIDSITAPHSHHTTKASE